MFTLTSWLSSSLTGHRSISTCISTTFTPIQSSEEDFPSYLLWLSQHMALFCRTTQQTIAYTDCFLRAMAEYKYVAVLDIDEVSSKLSSKLPLNQSAVFRLFCLESTKIIKSC